MREKVKIQCQYCKKTISEDNFYQGKNGKYPTCKKCLKNIVEFKKKSILEILEEMDKPLIDEVWSIAEHSSGYTLGNYFKMINSLPHYRNLKYKDSSFYK
ncbi:MAG: hypothetical protein ACRCX8_18835 [Sarcina sp.]